MEPTENVQYFCEKHSPKDPKAIELVKESPTKAIGKYAKIPFKVDDPNLGNEYMWVYVERYSNGLFSGRLSNDPIHIDHLALGDIVSFAAADVVALDG
jgi:uncharacterized protein YegJ (DUF2314 family)